jgi:hypothetical protein
MFVYILTSCTKTVKNPAAQLITGCVAGSCCVYYFPRAFQLLAETDAATEDDGL